MELLTLIQYGTPGLLLVIVVAIVRLSTRFDDVRDDIKDLKRGVIWNDTCEARHKGIDERLHRLERQRNGVT